jgi:hypothetical protein
MNDVLWAVYYSFLFWFSAGILGMLVDYLLGWPQLKSSLPLFYDYMEDALKHDPKIDPRIDVCVVVLIGHLFLGPIVFFLSKDP